MWCTKKIRTSPPQSRPVSAPATVPVSSEAERGRAARGVSDDEQRERAVDLAACPGPRRGPARSAASLGLALGVEQPARRARARGPEARRAGPSPWPTCGRVRIALLVGVRVVLAVVGDPVDDRALDRHRAQARRRRTRPASARLERAVGEQPVEADGHAERRSAGTCTARIARSVEPHDVVPAAARSRRGRRRTAATTATRLTRFRAWSWTHACAPSVALWFA